MHIAVLLYLAIINVLYAGIYVKKRFKIFSLAHMHQIPWEHGIRKEMMLLSSADII